MKINRIVFLLSFFLFSGIAIGQTSKTTKTEQWIKVSDDDDVEIYYNSNIVTDKKGQHIVWVKAVYHTPEWQRYFARQIGSKSLVTMTKTKAMYDDIYSYVMVRQVQCYNKAGKLLYDTGDDRSAGWGFVNASDPVGIVGEYLGR
jgi:hypothetical protein